MSQLRLSLPEDLIDWTKSEADARGFPSPEAYAAHLLQRAKDGADLRTTLLAADPVPVSEFNESFFASLDRIATGQG